MNPRDKTGTRINKYLKDKGYSTRKGADTLIQKGLVLLNGKKAVLGDIVNDTDTVTVKKFDQSFLYFAYNKPIGIVTTTPTKGEKEIIKSAKFPKGVFPVGRLDKDSHGLIIMTNDGRVTDRLLSPSHDHEKEYAVKIDAPYKENFLEKMGNGITIDDYKTKPAKLKRLSKDSFSITLTEGKNRQIRRMCEAFGYHVKDLKRIRIMNITLGTIKENESRQLSKSEEEEFLKSIGLKK